MKTPRIPFGRTSLLVVVLGLVVTAALSVGAEDSYQHNQRRLTTLQTGLTAAALGAAPVDFERRLGPIVGVVANSVDPSQAYRNLIMSSMKPPGPFSASSLIELTADGPTLLVHLGIAAVHNPTGGSATVLYVKAARSGRLVTSRAVAHGIQKLGYLMAATGSRGTFVVSGAQSMPARDILSIAANSPDSGLNIAIYFGTSTNASDLIASTDTRLPLGGPVSKAVVPFGTNTLTLVGSPRTALPGTLSAVLPWAIAGAGAALTIVIALLVERLVRRKGHAENLASESELAYREQRDVAVTLQRALLPPDFPEVPGAEFAAAYIPGARATEVGGDWYSVVKANERRFYFVVGDVSGHGIEAAALMAQLRFMIRALARLGHDPAAILDLASGDLNVGTSGHFATVVVGLIEDNRTLTIASAGHLPPLVLEGDRAEFVAIKGGVPLGVGAPSYEAATVPLARGATLIAFTDGLVETRSANLERGLERLRKVATSHNASGVDDLARSIRDELIPEGSDDDTALLVIRLQAGTTVRDPEPRDPAVISVVRPSSPAV